MNFSKALTLIPKGKALSQTSAFLQTKKSIIPIRPSTSDANLANQTTGNCLSNSDALNVCNFLN